MISPGVYIYDQHGISHGHFTNAQAKASAKTRHAQLTKQQAGVEEYKRLSFRIVEVREVAPDPGAA